MSSYPGGKQGGGAYQLLISQMPPHDCYVEAFAGGGAVLRHKRPAGSSIAIDADAAALDALSTACSVPGVTFIHGDALLYILAGQSSSIKALWQPSTLLYCDPPYMDPVLSEPGRRYYTESFQTVEQHRTLLDALQRLPCMVMISGYTHPLYALALADWRLVTYQAMTRGAVQREECLWMNYPEPWELHDARYVGGNYRERERIRRKQKRWKRMLEEMQPHERHAMLATLAEYRGEVLTAAEDERRRHSSPSGGPQHRRRR